MYKGRKHAGTIISKIYFLVLLLTTQILAKKTPTPPTPVYRSKTPTPPTPVTKPILDFLKCFGGSSAKCLIVFNPILKGFCVGKCIHKCIFKSNKLQGIDYCKPACIHKVCIHHLEEADDLKKENIDRYVNCVGECDKQIGECDSSSQLRASPVDGDITAL